ncbi:agmatinase [Flavobacteriaceae bacterium AU392]|nr:agmatinase [Flavobacteriaceae bacterium]RKM86923.1 agmatinase [Flavobacteriaceae bacterium AU392]
MIKLLGIPFDGNSSFLKGPALAPPRIRLMDSDGSANAFCESGIEIKDGENYIDLGDLQFFDMNPKAVYQAIKEQVYKDINESDKLICFGGDHSISFPIIEEHTNIYKNLNVLHLDAHADLYDNFENNPYSHASPFARLMEKGKIKSLTQVGVRTLNTHQKEQAKRFNVKLVEMKDFNLDFIKTLENPLYISLDLDVLDPAYAPGVSHHEPGGISTRELIKIIQSISAPIIGADIVEYNPTRDVNNMTAMVAYKLFKELVFKML